MKLKLIHGDCIEEMKRLPDKSIDLFLCDLPYGCLTNKPHTDGTEGKSKGGKNYTAQTGCSWDIKIDLEVFWEQVERLMKDEHTPIIHFCNTKFGYELIKSKEKWFRYDLVWNKGNGVGFLSANKMPMRSHENIYVFAKKGAKYNRVDVEVEGAKEWKQFGKPKAEESCYSLLRDNPVVPPVGAITSKAGVRCVTSVVEFPNKKGKGKHPTQKPEDLYKWLIERYSKSGDTILDPTAGSFASCKVALECGRQAIGIEKDDTFYEKAVKAFQS